MVISDEWNYGCFVCLHMFKFVLMWRGGYITNRSSKKNELLWKHFCVWRVVKTLGLSHRSLVGLPGHPNWVIFNVSPQLFFQRPFQMSQPHNLHTKDHFPRVTALSFGQCYSSNSFLNWWAEIKKNLCEWWDRRPGFNRSHAASYGIGHACFQLALLISSTVKAFHHIVCPNPGRFASLYGSQPSSPMQKAGLGMPPGWQVFQAAGTVEE